MPGGLMDERTPLPPGEHLEEPFNPLIDDFEPRVRTYLHFDAPPKQETVRKLTSDPKRVATHSFFPFLGFTAVERRYKRADGRIRIKEKSRDIRYASHLDSAIFEFYAEKLSALYELYIDQNNIDKSVLAYRSGIGSNIDHAADLFSEIRKRGNCNCIALDITGFFDNIQHSILKFALCKILNVDKLSDDYYKIYRNLTQYSWVSKEELETRLGRKITRGKNNRICSAQEFREKIRRTQPSIINRHEEKFGIPQGSALSGLFANIYLYEADINARNFCKSINASYRRYSDDIAISAPLDADINQILDKVRNIYADVGLEINKEKTEVVRFEVQNDQQIAERPFQYLGFTFDGRRILVRDSSLNRYYRKMTRAIRAARISAQKNKIPLSDVFLRRQYKAYTHKGKGRNFVRYAYRAAKKMNAPEIRRQLRNHTRIFQRKVSEEFGFKNK
jgi:retron-type reverse transcriptase